jgi:hypothetical protein
MRLAHSLSTGNHCQVASNSNSPPAEPGVYQNEIKGLIIMTTWPWKIPPFPGLTGKSKKALDARLRPAGMTRKQECNFN